MANQNVFKLLLIFSGFVTEILSQSAPVNPMPIITERSPAVSQRFHTHFSASQATPLPE